VLELTDEAIALWVRAGSYCAGHLTDGEVKPSTLRVLAADHNAATELVLAGLWDYEDGVWKFHDWAHYQPARETVMAEREAAAERMRQLRANRKRSAEQEANVPQKFDASSRAPSRPDPTRPDHLTDSVSQVREDDKTTDISSSMLTGLGVDPRRLITHIREKTGREVDSVIAVRIALHLLERGGPNVKDPQRYVLGSITKSPAEIRERIDAERPTPTPRRDPECAEHPGYPLPCHKCAAIAAEQDSP
jgi:hypothetical protein